MNVQNNSEMNMVEWKNISWKKLQRVVFRLQKRIYQASTRGDVKCVHKLQKLLLKSQAAKLLAVRKITQDNRGKATAGVDGVKSLNEIKRLELARTLKLGTKAKAVRRVWIPKSGKTEKRPLGIPTIDNRTLQALVKLALEPEWEAKFEPNSYGFRPNRCTQDAVETIFDGIRYKNKYVLDADISGCFDNINQEYLLNKLNAPSKIRKQVRAWLKAGTLDNGTFSNSETGIPQGGALSPLLANIALHGMEETLNEWIRTWKGGKRDNLKSATFVRYADDFVFIHESLERVEEAKVIIESFLTQVGLELKESKTHIRHTTEGFNFLGFYIRSYKLTGYHNSGKNTNGKRLGFKTIIKPSKEACQRHYKKLQEVFDSHKNATTKALIKKLNPIISGWSNYYQWVCSKETLARLDYLVFKRVWRWCKRRHLNKGLTWVKDKYFKPVTYTKQGKTYRRNWQLNESEYILKLHANTEVKSGEYVKVRGQRSPFDGDWKYWGTRRTNLPETPQKLAKLLKQQKGKCGHCGLTFLDGDIIEIDHIIPQSLGGSNDPKNLQALHGHCHDVKTRTDGSCQEDSASTHNKGQLREERDEAKVSRSVLKTSGSRKGIA